MCVQSIADSDLSDGFYSSLPGAAGVTPCTESGARPACLLPAASVSVDRSPANASKCCRTVAQSEKMTAFIYITYFTLVLAVTSTSGGLMTIVGDIQTSGSTFGDEKKAVSQLAKL